MVEELKRFEEAIWNDAEFGGKYIDQLKKIKEEKSVKSFGEAVVKAAEALGYEFTLEELEKETAQRSIKQKQSSEAGVSPTQGA